MSALQQEINNIFDFFTSWCIIGLLMSRPREFNEREILEKAMLQFWKFGYASTSLSDLEQATGIGKKSLYNSVGDKKAIFLRIIDLFISFAGNEYIALMERPDSKYDDIEKAMLKMLKAGKSKANGCLICNTSQEDIRDDKDINKVVQSYLNRVEAAFLNSIDNQLSKKDKIKAKKLSKWMFGVFFSACTMTSASVEFNVIEAFVIESLRNLKAQTI